jgi:hypothetical protein
MQNVGLKLFILGTKFEIVSFLPFMYHSASIKNSINQWWFETLLEYLKNRRYEP